MSYFFYATVMHIPTYLSYFGFEFSLRGHSLTGKTAILHIVILGSSPNVSNLL